LIALYLRLFQNRGAEQIERRTLIATSLLSVTGLDILGIILVNFSGRTLYPDAEGWNEPIKAWITTMLWLPHDLAALIGGFIGFLLVWHAAGQEQPRHRVFGVLGAGLAFASAAGASIFLGITFAVACASWLTIAILKHWRWHALLLAGAGILAAVLAAPFLLPLTHGLQGGTTGEPSLNSLPIRFAVRTFKIPDMLLNPANPGNMLALNTVLLPLNYFLEFGFFLIVGCLGVSRIWKYGLRNQTEWAAITISAASLFICTFTKSTVISSNDLGWMSALLVQFILLLWAAEMWNEGLVGFGTSREGQIAKQLRVAPRLVSMTLVMGVMGSCYGICIQRSYPILADLSGVHKYSWLALDQRLGRRSFELRRAYEEMDRILPARAIVQADPAPEIGDIPAELYSGRQMVADVGDCGTVFGGSKQFCNEVILPRLNPLFDDQQPVSAEMVSETCREFSITALLFKDTDPVWRDKSSWIWKTSSLLSNDFVRVIQCGGTESGFDLKQPSSESRGRIATAQPARHHS
jgi:MFS family permease